MRTPPSVPRACFAAVRRVLWLEDEIASCPSEDLETLDGAMRVLEVAYVTLERTALRAPRAHPLRIAALRMVGARRTWLAVAAEARPGVEDLEREATVELDAARMTLRRVHAEDARSNGDGDGHAHGEARANAAHGEARANAHGHGHGDAHAPGDARPHTSAATNVVSLAARRARRTS